MSFTIIINDIESSGEQEARLMTGANHITYVGVRVSAINNKTLILDVNTEWPQEGAIPEAQNATQPEGGNGTHEEVFCRSWTGPRVPVPESLPQRMQFALEHSNLRGTDIARQIGCSPHQPFILARRKRGDKMRESLLEAFVEWLDDWEERYTKPEQLQLSK
jgi:hypothetical protein